jgi:hypothetical protein
MAQSDEKNGMVNITVEVAINLLRFILFNKLVLIFRLVLFLGKDKAKF